MTSDITPTHYVPEFERYMEKAFRLQKMNLDSENGRDVHTQQVGDPLMDYVTIYDVVERPYAGFSNLPQQLWYGSSNPKAWQARDEFDDLAGQSTEWWLMVFLLHRLTGSGASFAHDHGFRNSVLPDIALDCRSSAFQLMNGWLNQSWERPVFTSIGNQPPQFGKVPVKFKDTYRAGQFFVVRHSQDLVFEMLQRLEAHLRLASTPDSIQATVDWALQWNVDRGLKRFKFVYTAWVMDIATYFPHLVEPNSHCYMGANAEEAAALLYKKPRGMKKQQYLDEVMNDVVERFQRACPTAATSWPMSLEDVLCDFIRYIENYIPDGYEHLDPHQVVSAAQDLHPVRHRSYHLHLNRHGKSSRYGVAT